MRNSENFGARITENRASKRKIWFWKLWRVNGHFRTFRGVFVEFLSGEKLWHERIRALAKTGNFLRISCIYFPT
jgi:hypothetical protein